MDTPDRIGGGHPGRIEIFGGAKRRGPFKKAGLQNMGKIGVGGQVAVEENAGLCLRFDQRLLFHALVDEQDDHGGDDEKQDPEGGGNDSG